ncbi:hypothetical protein HPP92_007074 [Vanilla planifolia]|uniref:Armadillo-like repeats domain-containing protein n=1 Tax=Vanilla planifolia TaxID=51239 RepID=A0A835VBI8_VANPL|nr:hypothetical protein HPP92_007074 [Vanilla planifolia]
MSEQGYDCIDSIGSAPTHWRHFMISCSTIRPLSAGVNLSPGSISGNAHLFPRQHYFLPQFPTAFCQRSSLLIVTAKARATSQDHSSKNTKDSVQNSAEDVEEVEEDLPWIQEKALDLVEFTGTVTQAIPGPRVGQSPLPWIVAIPLAYLGLSFVIAVFKTVKKFTSPRAKRRRVVNKNAVLLKSVDELFQKGRDEVSYSSLKGIMQKTGFNMDEILRKYIRYALNEKPFNPDTVADLIHLRTASMLEDHQVADVLNEISRQLLKKKAQL